MLFITSTCFLASAPRITDWIFRAASSSAVDIEFSRGRFTIAGTDRSVSILELADRLRSGISLPAAIVTFSAGLVAALA